MEYSLNNLMELVKKTNRNKSPDPMPEDKISQLRSENTAPRKMKKLLNYRKA